MELYGQSHCFQLYSGYYIHFIKLAQNLTLHSGGMLIKTVLARSLMFDQDFCCKTECKVESFMVTMG